MSKKVKSFGLLCLSITLLVSLTPLAYSSFDTPENKTLIQPQGEQNMSTNATNIILVHGGWADGSGWSKEIPILIEGRTQSYRCTTSYSFSSRRRRNSKTCC